MATKPQAKTAIDSAVTAVKADIDNILPVGVNITDGQISFGPIRWAIIMDAGGVAATADSWATSITTALTAAARTYVVRRTGRRSDDTIKNIIITTNIAVYFINNAG